VLAALLFDCDGVLVDTEKDGHRVTFNQAFAEKVRDSQKTRTSGVKSFRGDAKSLAWTTRRRA
jgi:beta-phosphoglucomutase-like phosphatase (HAD superfamily)